MPTESEIEYATEPDLSSTEFIDVLNRSGLGVRRPVDQPERIAKMIQYASLVITARIDGRLVGIARSVCDFSYCCYLSDLAVDSALHSKGIGKRLIEITQELAGDESMVLLLEAPMAQGYYEHVGFAHAPNAWMLPRKKM